MLCIQQGSDEERRLKLDQSIRGEITRDLVTQMFTYQARRIFGIGDLFCYCPVVYFIPEMFPFLFTVHGRRKSLSVLTSLKPVRNGPDDGEEATPRKVDTT